jgi:L-2-amino-thiazoline-4-carboxylic acid hydrolase
MKIIDLLIRTSLPMLAGVMKVPLSDKLSRDQVRETLKTAQNNYDKLAEDFPSEPTLGAASMVRVAAVVVAIYRALGKAGLSKPEALDVVSQMVWKIYRPLAGVAWMATRLQSGNRIRRVGAAVELTMFYPYSAPGYDIRVIDATTDLYTYDIYRCPMADYLVALRLSDLCQSAFCNLDFELARVWGVQLKRQNTIACGAKHCDFKFEKNE